MNEPKVDEALAIDGADPEAKRGEVSPTPVEAEARPMRYDANVNLIQRRLADGYKMPKAKWWWRFL